MSKLKEGREYIKRKSKRRAPYWRHFREYIEKDQLRAKCKYCDDRTFACDANANGSKNIKNHWEKCPSNPANHSKGKQTELILEPRGEGEADKDARMRNWTLNLNEVREALSLMVIVDKLPFRSVEKPGFKHLMSVACPRFNIPSRVTIARDCYEL